MMGSSSSSESASWREWVEGGGVEEEVEVEFGVGGEVVVVNNCFDWIDQLSTLDQDEYTPLVNDDLHV